MIVSVCRDLSDRVVSCSIRPGKLVDIYTELQLGNAVALVNGKLAPPELEVKESDIVFIRQVPGAISGGVALFIAGALLIAGASYAGYQIYQQRKQLSQLQEAMDELGSVSGAVTNLPYLKGANNARAIDKAVPYIIGKNYIAPYILSNGEIRYNTITSNDGNKDVVYRLVPYQVGYNNLVLRTAYANGNVIQQFTGDVPQEGTIVINAQSRLVISQSGLDGLTSYRYTRILLEPGDRLLKLDDPQYAPLVYTLPTNARQTTVTLVFNGLLKYSKKGEAQSHSLVIHAYFSDDGGATWAVFPADFGTITANTKTQMRVERTITFYYPGVKDLTVPIQIKISCASNAFDGSALEDVYVQTLETLLYDPVASKAANAFVSLPILDEAVADKSCLVGYTAMARNSSEEEAFQNFALVVEGVASTWDGTEWSATKAPTSNPASWLIEILTSSVHPQSQIAIADIDLDSFGELYEYCEAENIKFDKIYLSGEPKENIIQSICDVCYSTLYKNIDGKIAVATDKQKENAIAVINTQNCFSFSNKKDLSRQVDGLRVSFVNEALEYEQDTYEVMRPGITKDANSRIRSITADGITRYSQVVKWAWRLMAIESARPKVTTVEIGNEGVYYTPLSKVLVQHPSLKNGLGSAEIKNVVVSGGNIIGLDLYEPIAFDSSDADGYGMIVQCVSDDYCTPLAIEYTGADGLNFSVALVTPISTTADVIPHAGDTLSYGLLDSGSFGTITNPMIIAGMSQTERGWKLELVDYNEAIYEYGAIPEYKPNITQKTVHAYIPEEPRPATVEDVSKAVALITSDGSPAWIPDVPANVYAVASQNRIDISWTATPGGVENTNNKYTVRLSKNSGAAWVELPVTSATSQIYTFNRTTDGYPEVSNLSAWVVQVKSVNQYGYESDYSSSAAVDTSSYLGWIMDVPTINAKASGRSVDLVLYNENDFYGDYEFRIQISKDDGTNWFALGDSSLAWTDESSYKSGNSGGYTSSIFDAYRQVLPLTGQASDTPEDTEYWYKVALYHKQTTQITLYSSPFIVVCKPSSAKDLVSGAVKNAQLATGAVTNDKIAARTILTENLYVTARSKVNTLSNVDDGVSGWTSTSTRFVDGARWGLQSVAPNHTVNSDEFTVEPNEIVEVSFGLQLVDAAGSTGDFGISFGCTREQTFTRYAWDTTTKKWKEPAPDTNAYFIGNYQGSSIQFVKTFILGSNVNIKDVPAPAVSTTQTVYCLQLSVGDIKCRLRSGHNPVNNGYTWRLYQPMAVGIGQSKIVAEQIEVKNLSAINSHLGEINGDTEDYKLVMGSGGSAEEGTLLLGATTDKSYLRRWKEGGVWKMAIKLATFFVDAVSSKILGRFQVRNAADTATALDVDPSNPVAVAVAGGMSVTGGASVTGGMGIGGGLSIDGGTAWHSLNDGAGSGLDADTVDGEHSGALMVSYARRWVDITKNLNEYTSPGIYDLPIPEGTGWANYPVITYGTLIVLAAWSVDTIQMFCIGYGDQYYIRKRTYNSSTWTDWAKIWTSANDGAGSGLDADLLDGQHGSYYAPINSPALIGAPTAPNPNASDDSGRIATTSWVRDRITELSGHILVKENNPGTNQTIYIVPTGISDYGIILFKGIIYDVDDTGEYARFMSPSLKPMLILAEYKRTYTDSSGSIGYSDISNLSCATSRVVGPGTELARVTYSYGGADSVEYQCIAMLLP